MELVFRTPTNLSLLDLSSMGDSSKRGDSSTIGQFDSGLKYAIALLLRHGVKIEIKTDEDFFTFSTTVKTYNDGKQKELIVINSDKHGEVITGFAKNLGYNWELYMAFRELYSNMLDEKGEYFVEVRDKETSGTDITLTFDEDNDFHAVYINRHLYINENEPLFKVDDSLEVLQNDEQYARIYKNNILVYENKETPSKYAYNISFGAIDERRILNDVWSIKRTIADKIAKTTNEDFINDIVTEEVTIKDNDFLTKTECYYQTVSSEIINKVNNMVSDFNTFSFLKTSILQDSRAEVKGKTIQASTIYRNTVTIETIAVAEKEKTFRESILELYNLDIEDLLIKRAKLKGNKAITDTYNKCIIVDEDFCMEDDFFMFLTEYYTFKNIGTSNSIIEVLAKELVNGLKKV